MRGYDLDLLRSLRVLIEEESIAGAARRMQISEATMSRNLARLREVFNDPILVRSGRGMVASAASRLLVDRVETLVQQADNLIAGPERDNLSTLVRRFVIRANDLVIAAVAEPLLQVFREEAPLCDLVFAPETEDPLADAMRNDLIDIYLGASSVLPPEIRRQTVWRDRMRCLVRRDHPIFAQGVSAQTLVRYDHISVSRRGLARGPIDQALKERGLARRVMLVVPNYYAMIESTGVSDMILVLPNFVIRRLPLEALGLAAFDLPFPLPPVEAYQAWHPKWDADPAHRWLRRRLFRIALACQEME